MQRRPLGRKIHVAERGLVLRKTRNSTSNAEKTQTSDNFPDDKSIQPEQAKMALTKAKCREIFESVAGADGLLTPQELKTAIQNMSEAANLSSDDVDKIVADCFQGIDMDGDQKITLDEFVNELTKSGRKQKLKETFEAWDKDGSGELSKDELKSAIAETMDEDTANEIVDQINDDKITLDEFLELCN